MDPTLWIIVGVVLVIVTRRFQPVAASILGLILILGVGVWGWMAYDSGQAVGLATIRLSRPVFLGLIGVWAVFEVLALKRQLNSKKQHDQVTIPSGDDEL